MCRGTGESAGSRAPTNARPRNGANPHEPQAPADGLSVNSMRKSTDGVGNAVGTSHACGVCFRASWGLFKVTCMVCTRGTLANRFPQIRQRLVERVGGRDTCRGHFADLEAYVRRVPVSMSLSLVVSPSVCLSVSLPLSPAIFPFIGSDDTTQLSCRFVGSGRPRGSGPGAPPPPTHQPRATMTYACT